MIGITHKGNFEKTRKFFNNALGLNKRLTQTLNKYGKEGVRMLSLSTPVDTGKTAASWDYEIVVEQNKTTIYWTNSNVVDGVNIALILQTGHGTKNGGYVVGIDYINPALKRIFNNMASEAWEAVKSL